MPILNAMGDWRVLRDALEVAYRRLGLKKERTGDHSEKFSDEHWNLAVVIQEEVMRVREDGQRCVSCSTKLDFNTVIRCLDCRAQLCDHCARLHFGPNHEGRANAAHPQGGQCG